MIVTIIAILLGLIFLYALVGFVLAGLVLAGLEKGNLTDNAISALWIGGILALGFLGLLLK